LDKDYLLRLYDSEYAATYDEKFLTSELARSDADHEVRLLASWLRPGMRWLDVACGTGYFLGKFPEIEREGLDLSPAMLARAREANPGVILHQRSFLEANPAWHARWDLVSCMWYAYGLVDALGDIEKVVANLARWTSQGGRCFVPLADPRLIAGVDLPYAIASPWPGQVKVTGILWSYAEGDEGKVHAHQIAPQVEYMQELFERHFAVVELLDYPPAKPDWEGRRRALLAYRKRPDTVPVK